MKNALATMIGLAALTLPAFAQSAAPIAPPTASTAPQVEIPEGAFEITLPHLGIVVSELPGNEGLVRTIVIVSDDTSITDIEGFTARIGRDTLLIGPRRRDVRETAQMRRGNGDVLLVGPRHRSTREPAQMRRIEQSDAELLSAEHESIASAPEVSEYSRPEPPLPSAVELLAAANAGYSLANATPNPVSSTASISFTLPRAGRTSLAVYDNAGRVVATLVDEDLDAGTHTRTFDAGGIPAGLYLYRLSSGSYAETKTMTVVR